MGHNFVHGPNSNQQYYGHLRNRLTFSAGYGSMEFDSLLNIFLKKHSNHKLPDSIHQSDLNANNECECDCYPFKKQIYFDQNPREVFQITYIKDDHAIGAIDIVYTYRNAAWFCSKSSALDSAERVRVEKRFTEEILQRLK